MTQKSEMPTLVGLAQDMAGLVNAPVGTDLKRLQGALRILIEMTRYQERENCAKLCDELQKNHDRYYRTAGHDGKPYDPAHCAVAIRARSNVELTGAARHEQEQER